MLGFSFSISLLDTTVSILKSVLFSKLSIEEVRYCLVFVLNSRRFGHRVVLFLELGFCLLLYVFLFCFFITGFGLV